MGNVTLGSATGLSALDLYSMGLIPAAEVLSTILIVDTKVGEGGVRKGGKPRTSSIADIELIEVKPQRNFKLGIYLLHENGREPSAAN